MRKEIRNIQHLAKAGAFGNTEAIGIYIYGRRRDGKTVPCRSEIQEDGSIQIYSSYSAGGPYLEEDMTELTAEEWSRIKSVNGFLAALICNEILDARP